VECGGLRRRFLRAVAFVSAFAFLEIVLFDFYVGTRVEGFLIGFPGSSVD
jgi:hypothetical protein